MFKPLQISTISVAVALLAACGGSGGDGGGSAPAPQAGTGTYSLSLSKSSVNSAISETVVLTVRLTNTSGSAVTNGALSISMPNGLASYSSASVGAPCTSTGFTAGGTFGLTGLSVPAGATCTNTVTLTPSTPGTYSFPATSTSLTAGTTATLTIN